MNRFGNAMKYLVALAVLATPVALAGCGTPGPSGRGGDEQDDNGGMVDIYSNGETTGDVSGHEYRAHRALSGTHPSSNPNGPVPDPWKPMGPVPDPWNGDNGGGANPPPNPNPNPNPSPNPDPDRDD